MLFHFSENPSIERFEPQPRRGNADGPPVVWAIDDWNQPKYFFPRDCPRVCFWPNAQTTEKDKNRFMGMSAARMIIAVESRWLERIREVKLYRYRFAEAGFVKTNDSSGYYICESTVVPRGVEPMGDLLRCLTEAGVELRLTPSLYPLRDAILTSTIDFSMIRMANALPEPT